MILQVSTCVLSKISFIVLWCNNFDNFEYRLILKNSKYYKTKPTFLWTFSLSWIQVWVQVHKPILHCTKMKKSLMENFIFCAVLGQTMLDDRKTIWVLPQGKFTLYCLSQMFYKKDILKKFMWPATFLKKRLRHWCFYENVRKFLRTPFFIEHIHLQLLKIYLWKYDS